MRKLSNENYHFYFHFLDVEKNVPEGIHQKEVSSRVRQDEVIERNPLPKPGEVETDLIATPLTAVKFHILSQVLSKQRPLLPELDLAGGDVVEPGVAEGLDRDPRRRLLDGHAHVLH